MSRVRRTTQKIKLRRIFRILALERDRFGAHRQINAIQPVERKRLAVRVHRPCPADVDGAELAAFEEKRPPGFLVIRQFDRLDRHHAADHQPVEVGEHAAQFARREKAGDMESLPELLGGHRRDILRPRHPADGVFEHSGVSLVLSFSTVNGKSKRVVVHFSFRWGERLSRRSLAKAYPREPALARRSEAETARQ